MKNAHKRIDPHLRALEEENERLRRIIAKQSLEIEVKDELLKKALFIRRQEDDNQSL